MSKTYIIADLGLNHEGELKKAERLIQQAALCGANAVSIPFIRPELLIHADIDSMQYSFYKSCELPLNSVKEILEFCEFHGLDLIAIPDRPSTADYLHKSGVRKFKVQAGDLTYTDLLEKLASFRTDLFFDTGGFRKTQILGALLTVHSQISWGQLTLIHSVPGEYVRPDEVNLKGMESLKDFRTSIGFDNILPSTLLPVIAVSRGASVISCRIRPPLGDSSFVGKSPDLVRSLNPLEFGNMVDMIRETELYLNSSENLSKPDQRSWYYVFDLPKGHTIDPHDITALRPSTGIPVDQDLVGRILTRSVFAKDPVKPEDFEREEDS